MAWSLRTVVLLSCLLGSVYGEIEVIQDGNFILEYNLLPNDTLSVTATVRALGWVGVGLSPNADMTLADLIMGGFDNTTGSPYIGDYFAFGNTRPVEDIENNILTYSASENATHTVLHFTRMADTGDELEDVPVSLATHIIWAYNAESDSVTYHGQTDRGSIELGRNRTQTQF